MAEKLVQMDLTGIELSNPTTRMLSTEGFSNFVQEDDIDTAVGNTRVIVQGDRKKPAIITMHDIGLNSSTCFQGFFNYPDMQPILRHFCVYHMNCPGQQEGSLPLPQGLAFTGDPSAAKTYTYPTMDQLAEMILPVMQFYGLKTFIGFGVGSGANILSRFSMMHADRIEALVLINCVSGKAGWTEWGYQKVNTWHLKGGTMSTSVEDYLLWHWFGKRTADTSHDLVRAYTDHIKAINPQNLAHFIDSYVKRTDLCLVKETDPIKKKSVRNIKCPVLLVAGDFSAHLDDTVTMNSRLDPGETQFIKFHCGGMVLEEMPEKLCESFRLFLQGMGYVPNMSQTQLVETKARKRASLVNGSERTPIYTAPVHPPVPQQTHPKAAVDVTMC